MKRLLLAALFLLPIPAWAQTVTNPLTNVFVVASGGDCSAVSCTQSRRALCRNSATDMSVYACDTTTGFYRAVTAATPSGLTPTTAADFNLTREEYLDFLDDLYTGYFSARYDVAEGWFEADTTGADGDGFDSVAAPFTYINAGFLNYCGLKASQGPVDATLAARCASVIDKLFVSPVWAAGNDFTRSLNCTGAVGSPTCAAGANFGASTMDDRSDVFTLEAYPGAYLCWLHYQNLGIGTTRKNTLKSFIDDTINATPNGFNQRDLFTTPVHLYVKHLAGTSQVSAFSTLVGNSGGWGQRFDTAASVLPYVTDSFAWNYDQTVAQTDQSNFQTLEYLGFQSGAGAYEAMVAAGSTRNATADARLRAVGLRLMAYIGHNGWPSAWLTQYGSSRQDLAGYALGYVNAGLDSVMANSSLFSSQERRWAKYLFDRGIATYRLMDTYGGDAADGAVRPEPYGMVASGQEQDGDKAVSVAHIFRAVAWHLILGNDLIEAEEPPNLAWYDAAQGSLSVSTPRYSTFLYADVEGAYAYGSASTTYEPASGCQDLGFLTYNPTNEHVLERPDENQTNSQLASGYGGNSRRLQNGLFVYQSLAGSSNFVLDELSSTGTMNAAMLRPLMKTDGLTVSGPGFSGGERRPKLTGWQPTWKDPLTATCTFDRSDDSDAGFDDYLDKVTYTYHDEYIEENHEVTTPGGACATCFAAYIIRPPNSGKAFLAWAGHAYDPAYTIPVRYEVQRFTAADWEPTNFTITNGTCSVNCGFNSAGTVCGGVRNDSAGGVTTGNTVVGSIRYNTNQTVTFTHTIDADMGVTASANNRLSYQVIGRKHSHGGVASPPFLVTLDGGTQRSKSAVGGDTNAQACGDAGEVDGDFNQVIYNSTADDASTVMSAGAHTLAIANTNANNIYLDAVQVTSQSPARFLDSRTAGARVPASGMPSGDNDWYVMTTAPSGTSGLIAYFPDKSLITMGLEARFVGKPGAATTYNNDVPSPVVVKLFGDNYGQTTVAAADTTVPAFNFPIVWVPFNGNPTEAERIYHETLRWIPNVKAFSGAGTTMTISVNERNIDLTPQSRAEVLPLTDTASYAVRIDYANDDILVTRPGGGTSDAKVSWRVLKQ